eukprot:gb/GECG01008364.1/.p1 GENE.gb/GECG01008364.1/~~gb/GECG01008364.1/.p1  ORF type:complete len:707 (+),score=73.36 gb/GECG01008364.1/:1-2121(+)
MTTTTEAPERRNHEVHRERRTKTISEKDREEPIPKLFSVGPAVTGMLDDPPDTLPSFVVENSGAWMCRKCKGRKFFEANNHRVFFYDGKWRRRCAPCASKVRQRQRQLKRSRDSQEAPGAPASAEKSDIPITEFSTDPYDRVFPVKSMFSQKSHSPMAPVRHSVLHIPVSDIVAAPNAVEIRENAKKHVNFYGPLTSLCYKTAEKTVGGAIYDVFPYAKLEISPLTTKKFSVCLSTMCDAQQTESSVTSAEEAGSSVSEEPTASFVLRWDRSTIQLWHDQQPLVSAQLAEVSSNIRGAPLCTTVRSNIESLRMAIVENQASVEPLVHRVNVTDVAPPESGRVSQWNTKALSIEGRDLDTASSVKEDYHEDYWAVSALKNLQNSSSPSDQHHPSSALKPIVQSGDENLALLSRSPSQLLCTYPHSSEYLSVWVPRRTVRDGFQHEAVPHIQVLDTYEKVNMRDAKELLGPLKDWTVSNFVRCPTSGPHEQAPAPVSMSQQQPVGPPMSGSVSHSMYSNGAASLPMQHQTPVSVSGYAWQNGYNANPSVPMQSHSAVSVCGRMDPPSTSRNVHWQNAGSVYYASAAPSPSGQYETSMPSTGTPSTVYQYPQPQSVPAVPKETAPSPSDKMDTHFGQPMVVYGQYASPAGNGGPCYVYMAAPPAGLVSRTYPPAYFPKVSPATNAPVSQDGGSTFQMLHTGIAAAHTSA